MRAFGRSLKDFLIEGSATPNGLFLAEEQLLENVRFGKELCLQKERPEEPTCENKVRGSFIRFLALGGDEDAPSHETGVVLAGAYVVDQLSLQGCRDVRPIKLTNCCFEQELIFRDGRLHRLDLQGSRLPAINGIRGHVENTLYLRELVADGTVDLEGIHVGGALQLDRARIQADSEPKKLTALSVQRSKIGGSFYARNCKIVGSILMHGADVTGDVNFYGTSIIAHENAKIGTTLSLQRAAIGSNLWLANGFKSIGRVSLSGAVIKGNAYLFGGIFDATTSPREESIRLAVGRAPTALACLNMQVGDTLNFGPSENENGGPCKFLGSVDLRGASVRLLADNSDTWAGPGQAKVNGKLVPCTLDLDHFSYERISNQGPTQARVRLAWLNRQSRLHLTKDFRPQPFEQLVRVLRSMGHDADARLVAIQKQRRLAKAQTHQSSILPKPLIWFKRIIFGGLTGYGYRPERLLGLLLLVFMLSAAVFDSAGREGLMAPINPVVFLDKRFEHCRAPRGNWVACSQNKFPELSEHAPFEPFIYTMDLMLPVVDLTQERSWAPLLQPLKQVNLFGWWTIDLPGWLRSPWFLWTLVWICVITGWTGSLFLVAVLSGLVKKD